MKNTKIIFLTIFALTSSSCAIYHKWTEQKASCYWMENHSGKFEWVSVKEELGEEYNKQECFAADSCDGGLGESGGGCYKWAKSATTPRLKWD